MKIVGRIEKLVSIFWYQRRQIPVVTEALNRHGDQRTGSALTIRM